MRSRRRRTCRVSTLFDSAICAVTNTPSLSTAALRGVGAHLLKVGSKRRRKQADIAGQNEREELSQVDQMEQSQRILELEHQLSNVTIERNNNAAAAQILTRMIETGDAEQDASGGVHVSKRRPGSPNIVGNQEDF